jgi:hypothetical protein
LLVFLSTVTLLTVILSSLANFTPNPYIYTMTNHCIYWMAVLMGSIALHACRSTNPPDNIIADQSFGPPVKVQVTGYSGHLMEPFITRDGSLLLFNNLNAAPENTNLHWATRTNDSVFQYQGEIFGVNTPELEGVPTMDTAGNLYFVSIRSYTTTLSTIYQGRFNNGVVTDLQLVGGLSLLQPGQLNFDVEISADGQTVYAVDGAFGNGPVPLSADLMMARKTNTGFERLPNSSALLQNINTNALEYAVCISANQLELYFTRLALPVTANSEPVILRSTRSNVNEAFGPPVRISAITGFVEAATIGPDQRTLYYHKKENGQHVLYMVRK